MMKYNASRGGHAPGYIRNAFEDSAIGTNMFQDCSLDMDVSVYVEDWNGKTSDLSSLLGQLWNCTDIMPWEFCGDLELPEGSTYAQAARELKDRLERVEPCRI